MNLKSLRVRGGNFLAKSPQDQWMTARRRAQAATRKVRAGIKSAWHVVLPNRPLVMRTNEGVWFLTSSDTVGREVFSGAFETQERRFVKHFLKSDDVFVDVGAHHGLYTLIGARRVGAAGRVIAFEPSPGERALLERNIRLNRFTNVHIAPVAAGANTARERLFVFSDSGHNSLRKPALDAPGMQTVEVDVEVVTLDAYLHAAGVDEVDLIKLDIEGAELSALQGASRLLERRPRPVILCEVQDRRTRAWSYRAVDIVLFLRERDFVLLRFDGDNGLLPIGDGEEAFEENLIAVPSERMSTISPLLIKGAAA